MQRLTTFKLSTEDNKRKTCAPRIYSKMINENNDGKYEKYLHEINMEELMQDDEMNYLHRYFKERAGINEIHEIGAVIDKYFKIERTPGDHCILRDEGGARTQGPFKNHHTLEQTANNFRCRRNFPPDTTETKSCTGCTG